MLKVTFAVIVLLFSCSIAYSEDAPVPSESENAGVIDSRIVLAQDLLKHAAKAYIAKDFEHSARYIEQVQTVLSPKTYGDGPDQPAILALQRKVNRARTMLSEQGIELAEVVVLPRGEYEDFLVKYHAFIKHHEQTKNELNALKASRASQPQVQYQYQYQQRRSMGCSSCR